MGKVHLLGEQQSITSKGALLVKQIMKTTRQRASMGQFFCERKIPVINSEEGVQII